MRLAFLILLLAGSGLVACAARDYQRVMEAAPFPPVCVPKLQGCVFVQVRG